MKMTQWRHEMKTGSFQKTVGYVIDSHKTKFQVGINMLCLLKVSVAAFQGPFKRLRGTISNRCFPGSSEVRGSSLTLLNLNWMTPCRWTQNKCNVRWKRQEYLFTVYFPLHRVQPTSSVWCSSPWVSSFSGVTGNDSCFIQFCNFQSIFIFHFLQEHAALTLLSPSCFTNLFLNRKYKGAEKNEHKTCVIAVTTSTFKHSDNRRNKW